MNGVLAFAIALVQLATELLALMSASTRDEDAELKKMMAISRLVHDEVARRILK